MNIKTRCRECLYKNNTGTQKPCDQCNEIQCKRYGIDNYFVPADKNLMEKID